MSQSICAPWNDSATFVKTTVVFFDIGSHSGAGMSAHIHIGTPTTPSPGGGALPVAGNWASAKPVTKMFSAVAAACWGIESDWAGLRGAWVLYWIVAAAFP